MPLKPCLDCGRPCAGPRCSECTIDPGYSSAHWQSVRAERLVLDGYLCQLGHAGCTGRATTVHLDPSCEGDHAKATIGNTLSACSHCHGVEDGPRAMGYGGGSSLSPRGASHGALVAVDPRAPLGERSGLHVSEINLSRVEGALHPAGSAFLCTGFG